MPYIAYALPADIRDRVLERFPPAPGMEPVCDHVTRAFPASREPDAPIGRAARVKIVGRVTGDLNDVLVVTVDGAHHRRAGGLYHLTLGVDRARGGRSCGSNAVLEDFVEANGLHALRNLPQAIPLPDLILHTLLSSDERAAAERRAQLPPSPPPPQRKPKVDAVEDMGGGLRREIGTEGNRRRIRVIDASDETISVQLFDAASGRVLLDRGVYGGAKTADEAMAAWRADHAAPGLRS